MSAAAALNAPAMSPAQRVALAKRARAIRNGEVVIPLACPQCFSPSLERNEEKEQPGVRCLSCGRLSKMAAVKKVRRQRLARFLRDGGGVSVR